MQNKMTKSEPKPFVLTETICANWNHLYNLLKIKIYQVRILVHLQITQRLSIIVESVYYELHVSPKLPIRKEK